MTSRIQEVEIENAEGKLKEIYDRLGGKPPNILKVQSLNPVALETHWQLYRALMFGESPLSREEREMIATVVSAVNASVASKINVPPMEEGCHY
jgi:alkylhydroperoxidase family enzyme